MSGLADFRIETACKASGEGLPELFLALAEDFAAAHPRRGNFSRPTSQQKLVVFVAPLVRRHPPFLL